MLIMVVMLTMTHQRAPGLDDVVVGDADDDVVVGHRCDSVTMAMTSVLLC